MNEDVVKSFLVRLLSPVVRGLALLGYIARSTARVLFRAIALALRSAPVRRAFGVIGRAVRVTAMAAALVLLAMGVGYFGTARVPAGTIGVKQVNFGGRGIAERDHETGLAFSLPLVHSWHFVDRTTSVLTFAWASEGGDFPILEVRTRDGNVANVAAAIPHRVKRGEGWRLVQDGLKSTWRQRVKATVEKVLLQDLGALTTAELQSTDTRLASVEATLPRLNALLAGYHVEAEAILITQVWFGPQYEKQLTAQQALLQEAGTEVDAQRERIELFQQEIDASEKTIVAAMDERIEERYAAGRRQIAGIRAATKFYDQTRRSAAQAESNRLALEGDQLIARAEALRGELLNRALASSGGRLLLARQAAENLNIRQVTLNSNDPRVPSVLDVDAMVRMLVGEPAPVRP